MVPDLLAVAARNCPAFICDHDPAPLRDEVPVFTFHSVAPVTFEETLKFLAQNDYRTLSGKEFAAAISGETEIPERSVVLSFDDGRASLWTVAYPLLKKYGYQAISFIIPGCIPDTRSRNSKTGEDPPGAAPSSNRSPERSDFPLCSWEEIREMHESGIIDFQSHSMYHHVNCVSDTLVDFMHPRFARYFFGNINVPVYRTNGRFHFDRVLPLGTPIYRSEPRLAGRPQFLDDETLRRACATFVAGQGGAEFFRSPDWRKRLLAFYRSEKKKHNDSRMETPEEQRQAIFDDLAQSKKAIEQRLPGKTVDQLCYPWFMGSQLAVDISKEAGYCVNYWGVVPYRPTNRRNQNLYFVPRIEDCFIFRLPGAGRKSLRQVLSSRFAGHWSAFSRKLSHKSWNTE